MEDVRNRVRGWKDVRDGVRDGRCKGWSEGMEGYEDGGV